jgi:hypothetical protein
LVVCPVWESTHLGERGWAAIRSVSMGAGQADLPKACG